MLTQPLYCSTNIVILYIKIVNILSFEICKTNVICKSENVNGSPVWGMLNETCNSLPKSILVIRLSVRFKSGMRVFALPFCVFWLCIFIKVKYAEEILCIFLKI